MIYCFVLSAVSRASPGENKQEVLSVPLAVQRETGKLSETVPLSERTCKLELREQRFPPQRFLPLLSNTVVPPPKHNAFFS